MMVCVDFRIKSLIPSRMQRKQFKYVKQKSVSDRNQLQLFDMHTTLYYLKLKEKYTWSSMISSVKDPLVLKKELM